MPLSEHEQRLLDEMERSLYHKDADFVSTVSSASGRPNYRAAVLGILVALAGVVGLVFGVVLHAPIVGVIGFVVMFAGVLIALTPGKRPAAASDPGQPRRPAPANAGHHAGFMDRLNERWDKRQDGQN